jgi:serine protease AprX
MTTYSSKGPSLVDLVAKPDLVAPGNKIFSILAPGATLETTETSNAVPLASYEVNPGAGQTSNYFMLNGTSMAAGVASGAAAAILGASQNLTPDDVKARLMVTATKNFPRTSVITDPTTNQTFTIQYDLFTVGAGYLDLSAALASTITVPSNRNTASPAAVIAANPNPQTPVHIVNDSSPSWGSSAVWGDSGPWGTSAVWGDSVWSSESTNWGSSVVWGSSAVWGDSGPSGTSAVWGSTADTGTSAVWGDSGPSGTSAVWGDGTEGAEANGDPDQN